MSTTSDAATFAGVSLFGLITSMITSDDQREIQRNSFFGLNGIETLNGGGRGRRTTVTGVIYGDGVSGLAANEALFRSYRDGQNYALTEIDGTSWPQVQLVAFSPEGRRMTDSITGLAFRNYSATFEHML